MDDSEVAGDVGFVVGAHVDEVMHKKARNEIAEATIVRR